MAMGQDKRKKEFIAYGGEHFTIEWYYDDKGKSQALEYFEQLDEKRQDKVFYLFRRMGDHGEIKDTTKFRNEEDGVFAFKPQPDRFLCFFVKGNKIIVTNAFEKRQDKLDRAQKNRALAYKSDYEARVKQEKYYD